MIKFNSIKGKLSSQNMLIECLVKVCPLNQAIQVTNVIKNALQQENLQLPQDSQLYSKIEVGDVLNLFKITNTDGSIQQIKMGKILRSLFPNITQATIQNVVSYIKFYYMMEHNQDIQKYFSIEDDVSQWYSKVHKSNESTKSCMTGRTNLLKFYDVQDNIKLLVRYNENRNPVGRALIWYNVQGADNNTYIDRPYPPSDGVNTLFYKQYAKQKGYSFYDDRNKLTMTYHLKSDYDYKLPYLDTMAYYYPQLRTLSNNKDDMQQFLLAQSVDGTRIGDGGDDSIEEIVDKIRNLFNQDLSQFISVYNETLVYYDYYHRISYNDEQFFNDYFYSNVFKAIEMVCRGDYDISDRYLFINDYQFIVSFDNRSDIWEKLEYSQDQVFQRMAQIIKQNDLHHLI